MCSTSRARLGYECLVLTKFIEGSPISQFIQGELRARNIHYEGVSVLQGGPWGYRHQFNIADSGFGLRGPRVWNDRTGEVGRTLSIKEFDIERIFGEEGVSILHLSGLIAALSPETAAFCEELAKRAKAYGTKIAFDLNYRASFWKGREELLQRQVPHHRGACGHPCWQRGRLSACARHSGAGSRRQRSRRQDRGIQGHDRRSEEGLSEREILRNDAARSDQRQRASLGRDPSRGRRMVRRRAAQDSRVRPHRRRDGFTGGLLYGVFHSFTPEQCLQFAWASGVLAVTDYTDYASPADEEQVWSIYKGNARVKR